VKSLLKKRRFDMLKWQNPLLTLGERCVAFAENELKNGVKEDHPNSFSSPRLREYFAICTRLINGKEVPNPITAGNWCAASASFSLKNSLLPGEVAPHGYRLGVVEIVSDLQRNGLWVPVSSVRSGGSALHIGDLIIFDRSQPNKPETAWYRHIGRVYSLSLNGFQCISGNAGGCWKISNHTLSQPNLLGFGDYSTTIISATNQSIDWSTVDVTQLAPMEDTGKDLDSFFDIYEDVFK
jgi:hypothetical protein